MIADTFEDLSELALGIEVGDAGEGITKEITDLIAPDGKLAEWEVKFKELEKDTFHTLDSFMK